MGKIRLGGSNPAVSAPGVAMDCRPIAMRTTGTSARRLRAASSQSGSEYEELNGPMKSGSHSHSQISAVSAGDQSFASMARMMPPTTVAMMPFLTACDS